MKAQSRIRRIEKASPPGNRGPLVCRTYDDDPPCDQRPWKKCANCGWHTRDRGPLIIKHTGKKRPEDERETRAGSTARGPKP